MVKLLRIVLVLLLLGVVGYIAGKPLLIAWMMSVPETPFEETSLPPAPDYNNEETWAALPWTEDGADWLPANGGYIDAQADARVDVFFVYPTAAFYGDYWVAGLDNLLHNMTVNYGSLPQHVTAFNGAGKIYAPFYRSVRMPIWGAEDRGSMHKATALAYSDVRRAFEHYLEHWNEGRPFIIASHSQGTLHTIRLLREMVEGKPLAEQFVAGYLIGNTIADVPWFEQIPLCESAEQIGCFVTWNTLLEGGDPYHWVGEKGLDSVYCVNPLSWRADEEYVDKSVNQGSIPMASYRVLFKDNGPLSSNVVGARCGPEGMVWIKERPAISGYTAALFENGYGYHTYDINFYFDSIRNNAKLRASEYFKAQEAK